LSSTKVVHEIIHAEKIPWIIMTVSNTLHYEVQKNLSLKFDYLGV